MAKNPWSNLDDISVDNINTLHTEETKIESATEQAIVEPVQQAQQPVKTKPKGKSRVGAENIISKLTEVPVQYKQNKAPQQQHVRIAHNQYSILKALSESSNIPINYILINILNEVLSDDGTFSIINEIREFVKEQTEKKSNDLEL